MDTVFKDLKVIEIASVLAGPSVGMYFAERGAQVIKIENKLTNGDVTRSWKLSSEDDNKNTSAYFASVNWNKEHVFLNFKDANELQLLHEMISTSDIVLTNFKQGGAAKFGLDFESLKQLKEDIILGSISGYGEESERVAFDLILQADSGFMSMNGSPTSGPIKMPVALIDILAGHQLKEGLLEALLIHAAREKSALHVSVSLYEAALASLANQATNYLIVGHVPQRMGSKHPNIAPYGELFDTQDGRMITFAIGSDSQWQALLSLLDLPSLDKFSSNQDRVKNRAKIEVELQSKIERLNAQELLASCHSKRIPAAIIRSLDEVLNDDSARELMLKDELGRRLKTTVYKIQS